jgi:hypothetical protein
MTPPTQKILDIVVEMTQTILALGITFATIYISINGIASETMTNSFFLIVGFYFGKEMTNKAVSLQNNIKNLTN